MAKRPKQRASNPESQPFEELQRPIFRLPICGNVLSEAELWGTGEKPVLLRPKDLKRYGLPEATVNDMVYRASETVDPIPFLKLGRKTLIPRVALEAWIIRQTHVRELISEEKKENVK